MKPQEEKETQKRRIIELEDEVSDLKEANKLSYKNERYLFGLYQAEKRKRKELEKEIKAMAIKGEKEMKETIESMMLSNEIVIN